MQVQQYQSLKPLQLKRNPSTGISYSRSNSSIDSNEGQYRKQAILWILKLRKKLTIAKDTLYAAIAYVNKFVERGHILNEANYQQISVAMLLISCKMNEIYPPKMTSLIYRCTKEFTKEDLINTQAFIIEALDFDVAFTQTAYNYIGSYLENDREKLDECQKLLSLVVANKDVTKYGDEILAWSIIYLIKPSEVKAKGPTLQRIKLVSGKLYNIYIEIKSSNQNK